MAYKWMGAMLVVMACGGFGIFLAGNERQEEAALRQLLQILDFMDSDLQYRMTPLPELCIRAGKQVGGLAGTVVLELGNRLNQVLSPEVSDTMEETLRSLQNLPVHTRRALHRLGRSLGQFDLSGQLKGLDSIRRDCNRKLEELASNRDQRLRGYKTLGFCAGAAIVILFV